MDDALHIIQRQTLYPKFKLMKNNKTKKTVWLHNCIEIEKKGNRKYGDKCKWIFIILKEKFTWQIIHDEMSMTSLLIIDDIQKEICTDVLS